MCYLQTTVEHFKYYRLRVHFIRSDKGDDSVGRDVYPTKPSLIALQEIPTAGCLPVNNKTNRSLVVYR